MPGWRAAKSGRHSASLHAGYKNRYTSAHGRQHHRLRRRRRLRTLHGALEPRGRREISCLARPARERALARCRLRHRRVQRADRKALRAALACRHRSLARAGRLRPRAFPASASRSRSADAHAVSTTVRSMSWPPRWCFTSFRIAPKAFAEMKRVLRPADSSAATPGSARQHRLCRLCADAARRRVVGGRLRARAGRGRLGRRDAGLARRRRLRDAEAIEIEVTQTFADFEEYWEVQTMPFTVGQDRAGPRRARGARGRAASAGEASAGDGTVTYSATAVAGKARKP